MTAAPRAQSEAAQRGPRAVLRGWKVRGRGGEAAGRAGDGAGGWGRRQDLLYLPSSPLLI